MRVHVHTHLRTLQVHVVVAYLEVYAELIDQRYIVPGRHFRMALGERLGKKTHTSTFVVAQAIMSFTATRNRPPVSATIMNPAAAGDSTRVNALLLTMETYSSSVGHCSESRHRSSSPCPRCKQSSSARTALRMIQPLYKMMGRTCDQSIQLRVVY